MFLEHLMSYKILKGMKKFLSYKLNYKKLNDLNYEVNGNLMKRKIIAISFSILTLIMLNNPTLSVHAQDVRLRSTAETPFDTDGQYTVSWDVVPNAANYALEEATNIEFIESAEYYPSSNF